MKEEETLCLLSSVRRCLVVDDVCCCRRCYEGGWVVGYLGKLCIIAWNGFTSSTGGVLVGG